MTDRDAPIIRASAELLRAVLAGDALPLGVTCELDAAGLAFGAVRSAFEKEDTATAARLITRAYSALASAARIAAHEARIHADARDRRRRR